MKYWSHYTSVWNVSYENTLSLRTGIADDPDLFRYFRYYLSRMPDNVRYFQDNSSVIILYQVSKFSHTHLRNNNIGK